ncbi:hypothetical protein [Nonomuraea sp. SBT364]|uniref:hypothetical protein n=1 Tax=Nonomuraea sp. SBT364 TaxID=1580530 RepID=UPI00066E606B|nr:hypothetical protein [Nonomuraea sp. SBT364]
MNSGAAALNNAEWCDALCRAHGLPGVFTETAWTNPSRTPIFYPDAVTLSPSATAGDILPAVDAGPGASVKDSFATLDLGPAGFEVLFEATWIHLAAPAAGDAAGWAVVRAEEELAAWADACFDGERPGLFPPSLLADETVAVLRGEEGGAVLNVTRRAPVVGVSNVFGDAAWPGVIAMAAALFPGRPLVGYETDPGPAITHGFVPAGPLRVWLKR